MKAQDLVKDNTYKWRMNMKIGCAAWCFTAPHYQAPYEPAIQTIGNMGFDAIELIAHNHNDVEVYYTKEKIKELRQLINSYNMEISQFALYTELTQGLASMKEETRENALRYFEKMVMIGHELGTDMINMVSNWINDYNCPVSYLPNYWSPFLGGAPFAELTQNMKLPDDYDSEAIWKQYMLTLKRCLEICKKYDMRFNIEGHANVIVGNSDAMMRMFDHISDESLGINVDVGWHLIQREYIPMVIEKLGKKVFHMHLRDGDGAINYGLPPGRGINNWEDTFTALRKIKYDGVVSFEITHYLEPEKVIGNAKKYIESIMEITK